MRIRFHTKLFAAVVGLSMAGAAAAASVSPALDEIKATDPEFTALMQQFADTESASAPEMKTDPKHRALVQLAVLIGTDSQAVFEAVLPEIIKDELKPLEVRELVYQSAAYLGLERALSFIKLENKVFKDAGLSLPLENQGTVDATTRREKGTAAQVEIFGPGMADFWQKGAINLMLAGNCFGDYYTRGSLNLQEREFVTFGLLAGAGLIPQLESHVQGNLNMKNEAAELTALTLQMVPYLGYPRTLNTLGAISKVASQGK